MTKKRNLTFSLLYFIGILMVIDDHTGNSISLLSNIFPYNSFYMPMFFFCSGYFFTKKPVMNAIKHKAKRIFIPYVGWNIFFCIVAFMLDKLLGTNWIRKPTFTGLLTSFIGNPITSLNGPSWFLVTLFWVEIIYIFIYTIKVKDEKIFDFITTLIMPMIGILTLHLCINNIVFNHYSIRYIYRIMFYLQFYHYGSMFKKYIEQKINYIKNSNIIIISACCLINTILISIFGLNNIIFASTSEMASFKSAYLPLITSITGIMFYYELASTISKHFVPNKIFEMIANNTLNIMEVHLLYANVPNIIVFMIRKFNKNLFVTFNESNFIKSAWLTLCLDNRLVYFFSSLILSIITIYIINKIKHKFYNKKILNQRYIK